MFEGKENVGELPPIHPYSLQIVTRPGRAATKQMEKQPIFAISCKKRSETHSIPLYQSPDQFVEMYSAIIQ